MLVCFEGIENIDENKNWNVETSGKNKEIRLTKFSQLPYAIQIGKRYEVLSISQPDDLLI